MPIDNNAVNTGIDIVSGGGILGGVVAAFASVGWWLRKERSEGARTNQDIAASRAGAAAFNGQATEIEALRIRISALDSAFVKQSAEMAILQSKVAALEAGRLGAAMHVSNLLLCEPCTEKNARLLAAIERALESHDDFQATHAHHEEEENHADDK